MENIMSLDEEVKETLKFQLKLAGIKLEEKRLEKISNVLIARFLPKFSRPFLQFTGYQSFEKVAKEYKKINGKKK